MSGGQTVLPLDAGRAEGAKLAPYRVGVDENGLGARLGPLIVTAVAAEVTPAGRRLLDAPLDGALASVLDDSKRLINHKNFALGEAWARVLSGRELTTPQQVWSRISHQSAAALTADCPPELKAQCWNARGERFVADAQLVETLWGHVQWLARHGVKLHCVRVASVCTLRLNRARDLGGNRFTSDLHAMEDLLLALRKHCGAPLEATCGKVGGMSNYAKFFGPLSGHLHTPLEVSRRQSVYHFPQLGRIRFAQDADASDPLVMLASLVGKYIRELLMARIWRFYPAPAVDDKPVSGYHDPRTRRWVEHTSETRRRLRVAPDCFERR